jgi:hypothetical protein
MPEIAGRHPIATLPLVAAPVAPADVPASYDYAFLYSWQQEALKAWHSNGRQGVIEAVTGSGKTRVGIAAAFEAVRQGIKAGRTRRDFSAGAQGAATAYARGRHWVRGGEADCGLSLWWCNVRWSSTTKASSLGSR